MLLVSLEWHYQYYYVIRIRIEITINMFNLDKSSVGRFVIVIMFVTYWSMFMLCIWCASFSGACAAISSAGPSVHRLVCVHIYIIV